jgi:tetratricopeptide (TPR) repeat protein
MININHPENLWIENKMKRPKEKIYVSLLLAGLLVLLWGSPLVEAAGPLQQERFLEANRLYEEGKYDEALNIYLEQEKNGAHWKLFYNAGNCYFKLNRPVRAKIYYLKAQRLNPFEESIEKNIDIVNKVLNDKIEISRSDFISRVLLRIESIVSVNMVSILLLLLLLAFNAFVFMLLKKGKSRFRVYGVSFTLVLALLVGSYHIYRVNKHNRRDIAVITKTDSQLRSGPGQNNTVLFKVNPGLKVRIIDQSRDWLQVSASSDIAGWIQDSNLEKI